MGLDPVSQDGDTRVAKTTKKKSENRKMTDLDDPRQRGDVGDLLHRRQEAPANVPFALLPELLERQAFQPAVGIKVSWDL